MSEVRCFLLERTALAQRSLRRYASLPEGERCGVYGFHNASVVIEAAVPFESEWNGSGDDSWPHDDPHWPAVCEGCGYTFQPEDRWQHNLERLFRHPETGELFTHREAPAGAMCFGVSTGATSAEALARGVPPCGNGMSEGHLSVKLPDGTWWDIDAPASRDYRNGGSGWTRQGEPPNVTANPSILVPRYHGCLRNGVLVEC